VNSHSPSANYEACIFQVAIERHAPQSQLTTGKFPDSLAPFVLKQCGLPPNPYNPPPQ